jgi:hypothetical protein
VDIPMIAEEDPPALPPDPVPIFSEKPFKRLQGGPPPRGKPKPPVEMIMAGSAEETAAVHRAMDLARR